MRLKSLAVVRHVSTIIIDERSKSYRATKEERPIQYIHNTWNIDSRVVPPCESRGICGIKSGQNTFTPKFRGRSPLMPWETWQLVFEGLLLNGPYC